MKNFLSCLALLLCGVFVVNDASARVLCDGVYSKAVKNYYPTVAWTHSHFGNYSLASAQTDTSCEFEETDYDASLYYSETPNSITEADSNNTDINGITMTAVADSKADISTLELESYIDAYNDPSGGASSQYAEGRIMDIVLFENENEPVQNGHGSPVTDIDIQVCSTLSTTNGVSFPTGSSLTIFDFNTYNYDGEYAAYDKPHNEYISSINQTAAGEICEDGVIGISGRYALISVKAKNQTRGAHWTESVNDSGGIARTINNFNGTLKTTIILPETLPAGVKCYSASGVFKGCEGTPGEKSEPLCPVGTGPDDPGGCGCGDDIDPSTESKQEFENDYADGLLVMDRHYRSDGSAFDHSFGQNWRSSYGNKIDVIVSLAGTNAEMTTANITGVQGLKSVFYLEDDDSWSAVETDNTASLEYTYDTASPPNVTGYLYTSENDEREFYDSDGLIIRTETLWGGSLDYAYDGSDRLSTVTDDRGKNLTYSYNGSDQVSSVVTPIGTFSYSYDGNDNLSVVTKPDAKTVTYHYEDTTYFNALTGITNEENVRYATWGYDAQGRPISSEHAGGVNDYDYTYNVDGSVTVTNSLGKDATYHYEIINGMRKLVEVEGHASANCALANREYEYDSRGYLISETDWNGNVTTYVRDDRGLATSITEDAYGLDARTTTTSYESVLQLPDVVTETGKTTDYDYDSDGRVTAVTLTDTNTAESRSITISYTANSTDGNGNLILGKPYQVDGPRTDVSDVTTYEYDSSRRVNKITDAEGLVTEFTSFDSANRPLVIEDANDVQTVITYDTLGRVLTSTVAHGTADAAVTTYTYDGNGNVLTIANPVGLVFTYSYDDADRMTGIEDDLGNTITYTLDDAGNVITEVYKDIGATLKYTHSRTFDELSRLLTATNAVSDVTSFTYDLNSNTTEVEDGELNATDFAFDGLNRLESQTDALSGVTSYDLNELNQNEGTTDPRNNTTSYSYNAFGDVTQEVSPDRGTISYSHDKAGNVTQMTDARSVVTNYTYDAINRLTDIEYPSDSTLDVTLIYDSTTGCGTSRGRLCSVVDASGTTDYIYDDLGQLTSVTETRGALSFTTSYSYDASGVLTGITLPSGRDVDYTLNGNGQVSGVAADVNSVSTTLASSITYLPFGPMSSMSYGNSVALTNSYDTAYQLTAKQHGSLFYSTYTYDNAGNITATSADSYTLDDLYRITGENSDSYSYDAIGNRTYKNSVPYVYPSTSSRLSSINSVSLTTDSAGNITQDTARDYTIDAAGRLESIDISSITVGEYVYNASNQRTSKTVSSVTTHYVYGLGGLLYGEYDASGNLIREYVYLHGKPLAQIDDVSSSDVLSYIHTDHLGTPRVASNTSGTSVWAWSSDTFGIGTPTGTATVNLRFAGQYFDDESDLHYNWNRYYDPETGRYISSDPIGLAGGLNTYGYASANPVMFTDPEGLVVDRNLMDRGCDTEGGKYQQNARCAYDVKNKKAFSDPNGPYNRGGGNFEESIPENKCVTWLGHGAAGVIRDSSNSSDVLSDDVYYSKDVLHMRRLAVKAVADAVREGKTAGKCLILYICNSGVKGEGGLSIAEGIQEQLPDGWKVTGAVGNIQESPSTGDWESIEENCWGWWCGEPTLKPYPPLNQ